MTTAPIQKRLLADIIDIAIFITLFLIAYLVIFSRHETFQGQSGSGYSYGVIVPTNSTYLILLISWTTFMILTEFRSGQTIGKRLVKIKVVGQDLTNTTFVKTFTRHLFDIVDMALLFGLIIALTNKNRQRIGDLVAKTIIVDQAQE